MATDAVLSCRPDAKPSQSAAKIAAGFNSCAAPVHPCPVARRVFVSPLSRLPDVSPWHHHAGSDLFRLQALDRSMLGAPSLYLAASDGVAWQNPQGPIDLRADDWLGSGTLRNSFYVEPWARLTAVRDLALVIDAQGSLRVRVMCASLGKPAQVLRETRLESIDRGRLVLPVGAIDALPANSRLFWHIDAIDGARVHEAAWCSRTRPNGATRLAVLMRTFGRTNDLREQLTRLADAAAGDAHCSALLARMDFWVLDASADADTLWRDADRHGLNLRVLRGPNLGGGGNASHLIHHFLAACDAALDEAPQEVLILDDDGVLSMESMARYLTGCALRTKAHVTSLPILMKSRPTQVWEDGGFWGRLNFQAHGEFGRRRNLSPHLLKHGLSLDGFEHLDAFGPLNHCEYATFIFFGLPTDVLRRVGLPAAFFLRGDDIEYSLRAQAAGVEVITNPNLAAWHEPGHSYAQEYMAILHAVLINLAHSEGDAADLARWFEQRLAEHASIDDLEGLGLYLRVIEALLDVDGPLLTPGFEAHYLTALPACATPMDALPQGDRQRLEREAAAQGLRIRPFLYPGYEPQPERHRAVVLVNHGAGTYRELQPAEPLARLRLMQRYLARLQSLTESFEVLRAHWQQRLAASGQAAFWAEVATRHANVTRTIRDGGYIWREAAVAETAPFRSAAPLPPAVPIRELRQRLERELAQLSRLRQAEAAASPAARAATRRDGASWLQRLAGWWGRGRKPTPRRAGRLASEPPPTLPADFDPAQYLALNADVARTGIDAALHYAQFGRTEGRRYRL
jgi:GT2 family glycosyltransferase